MKKLFPQSSSRESQRSDEPSYTVGATVLYENNSVPLLGLIVRDRGKKIGVMNQKGSEIELASERLYLLPGKGPVDDGKEARVQFLEKLWKDAESIQSRVQVEELWQTVLSEPRAWSCSELAELVFGANTPVQHLATYLTLISDPIFFKRSRHSFEPRNSSVVEELKVAAENKQKKEDAWNHTIQQLKTGFSAGSPELTPDVQDTLYLLEDLAVGCAEGESAVEARDVLERCLQALKFDINGSNEERAYILLERIGYFGPRTNPALLRYHPQVYFSRESLAEAQTLLQAQLLVNPTRRDLRELATITIDDSSTKDMDDALSIESIPNGYRLGVHISDVAALLQIDSALDRVARERATSIYCPEQTINMLPSELCENALSLVQDKDRLCISYIFDLDRQFNILSWQLAPSAIKVGKRFSYDQVDRILETPVPPASELKDWDSRIHLLYDMAVAFETARVERGALKVSRPDANIIVDEKGLVSLVEIDESSPARSLIGEMMILANTYSARFAAENRIPFIFRGQPASEEDPHHNPYNIPPGPALDYMVRSHLKRSTMSAKPEPHFTLGLDMYTQVTSPIRRYADLCNQRQLLAYLEKREFPYTNESLEQINIEIEDSLGRARNINKESRRFWLLRYVQQQRIAQLTGTVIRVDLKNPLVEVKEIYLPVTVQLQGKRRPGEVVKLKVAGVNPRIDQLRLAEGS